MCLVKGSQSTSNNCILYCCQSYCYCAVPGNTHTHPMDNHWKFRGGGVSKAKIFKGQCEAEPEFPEGWGGGGRLKQKNHPWGRYGYHTS